MQKEQNKNNIDTIRRDHGQISFQNTVNITQELDAKSIQQNSRGKNFCMYE